MNFPDLNANLAELTDLIHEAGESERILPFVVAMLGNFTPQEIRDGLQESFPDPPPRSAAPTPHALISPDGVIVLVLRGDETPDDVRKLVVDDVRHRYGIAEMKRMIAARSSLEQVVVRSFRLLIEMKTKYRVESLAGVAGEDRSGGGQR